MSGANAVATSGRCPSGSGKRAKVLNMQVMPLEPDIESIFLKFLMRDITSNFFALLNLKFHREKTKFWVALEKNTKIMGYLLEHDARVINLRGDVRCAAELLKMTSLVKPELNIEPAHVQTVERFYEPTNPIGFSRDKVNVISAMEVDKKHFKPIITCYPKKLGANEFSALEELYVKFYEEMILGRITREQIREILNRCIRCGITYGIYDERELVSVASGNSILKNVAHIAPVYTLQKFRRRGYATSACSALVRELLNNNEKTILFVSEKNFAALKVYEKIGFVRTGHTFLTFWARRIKGGS
jgi:GNAT superfamily N-acetyltransferase